MKDRRKGERRSFDGKKRIVWTVPMEGEQEAIEGIERRKTIIKAGRRANTKDRRGSCRCELCLVRRGQTWKRRTEEEK